MRTSVLMVVFATFYAEWIHKTQGVPHTGRTATKGEMRRTHCDYIGTPRRVWTPFFFVPFGCLHWKGLHYLLGRFSFSSARKRLEHSGVVTTRDKTSEVSQPQRSFWPLGMGNLGTFSRLNERSCSPTAPLPFEQKSIRCLGYQKGTEQHQIWCIRVPFEAFREMPGPRFELGTRRFSVACSTN